MILPTDHFFEGGEILKGLKRLVSKTNRPAMVRGFKSCFLRQLNKQVWFNGRTSASQAEGAGSIPVTCSSDIFKRIFILKIHLKTNENGVKLNN